MGKYLSQMIGHVPDAAGIRWTLFGDRPEEPFHSPTTPQATIDVFNVRGFRFHLWEQVGLPSHARRANVHIIHCTATTLPRWQPRSTVVTVHDTLMWQSLPEGRYERWYLDTLIPAAFRRCAAVITISRQSQKDILALWPDLESKLHVIPHGVDDSYVSLAEVVLPKTLRQIVGPGAYALYVGGELERKRFGWALSVFEGLAEESLRLVVCGFTRQGAMATYARLAENLRDRVIFLPFVSEPDMPALYQNAVAVLYPTLYEGFGFPVVEAQAVGTPVLFSALGSLQELIGPASEVLPSHDMNAWVDTLRRLFAARGETRGPNLAARVWARKFSWNVSSRRHVEVYRSVMGSELDKVGT